MTYPLKAAVGGKFKIVATRPDGTQRVLADWFDNIILDAGFNKLMVDTNVMSICRVGSGTTAPAANQTGLATQVASTSTITESVAGNSSGAPYYGWNRRTFRFAAGVATGDITEVGVGWAASGASTLFSRALVRNTNGDPITLTVLADEVLDVSYELRVYAPADDLAFNVTISGVTYACVMRASQVTGQKWQPFYAFVDNGAQSAPLPYAYSGDIAPVTAAPAGTSAQGTGAWAAYTNGTFARTFTATFSLNVANFGGGIKSVTLETLCFGTFQCNFTPVIAKDANKIFTLNCTLTLTRYTP
jgi:hypothetical protein